jgi:hypothetical protein
MLRRCQVGLLHKKPLEWAGAMPTPFWRPSFEFRLECDGSLWLKSFIARTSACGLPKASSGHPSINRAAAITAKGLDWSEAQTREFVASRKTANPHLSAAVRIAKGGDMRLGGSCDGTGREPISS